MERKYSDAMHVYVDAVTEEAKHIGTCSSKIKFFHKQVALSITNKKISCSIKKATTKNNSH